MTAECINVCQLNDSDVCIGCHRTIDEITTEGLNKMSVMTLSKYKIVCKETKIETYEVTALTKEQALDYMMLDGTLKPVSSRLKVSTPVVTIVKDGEENG